MAYGDGDAYHALRLERDLLAERVLLLESALHSLRLEHRDSWNVDDGDWVPCPGTLTAEECGGEQPRCNCGAAEHNAIIEGVIGKAGT